MSTRLYVYYYIKSCLVCTPLAPSDAPRHLAAQIITSTSVMLTWNEVDCLQQNGDVTGYIIVYFGDSKTATHSSDGVSRTYTVQGLNPFTEYSFSVAAVNSIGTGPFSDQALTVRTAESSKWLKLIRNSKKLILHSCIITQLLVKLTHKLLPLSSHQLK